MLVNILSHKNGLTDNASDSLLIKSFLKESLLNDDFMEVKDFFYNVGKSLDIGTVMESKILRPLLFSLFYNFIDAEYTVLYLSKNNNSISQTS